MSQTRKVAKETPLAEIVLRKYEKPYKLQGRQLVKKLCLSIGLLQPGDSRDVIVDVLQVILKSKRPLSSSEIEKRVINNRKRSKLDMTGTTTPNILRQIRRLKESFLIENFEGKYRITEKSSLIEIFEEKIKKYYISSIIDRVEEYFKALS